MKTISVGRSPKNDLVIQDVLVSTHHLLLICDEAGTLFVEDLQSTNGTLIDGALLRGGRQVITPNTLIKIGETILEWQNLLQNKPLSLPKTETIPEAITPLPAPIQPEVITSLPAPIQPETTTYRADKPTLWLFWTAIGMAGFLAFLLFFWYFTYIKNV